MIFPTTYELTLALGILAMLCWGCWASTFKLAGPKWRFELFYFDFAFGALVAALLVAFTFGSMGDELSFADNVLIAGKRQIAFALAAGAVFNLANMLLLAGVSIAGLSVAFPLSLGLAAAIGIISKQIGSTVGNVPFVYGSAALLLVGVIVAAMLASSTKPVAAPVVAGRNANLKSSSSGGSLKGVIVSVVSGILLAAASPLVSLARDEGSELGLGAYALLVFMAVGIFLSTLVFNLYFINLPVHGEALELGAYLKGGLFQHLAGILGGLLWCGGTIANFVAASPAGAALVPAAITGALGQGGMVLSALLGLLIWRELKGASGRASILSVLMLLLLIGGIGLMALYPATPTAAAPAAPTRTP
ncbi:MAG: hypothetical protein NTZ56_05995 [Acidobacteria bacterium]|nr:hypothetical protein [Acidobacteriota bacterium]